MLDFPLWKRISLWAVTLLLALAALPSIASLSGVNIPDSLAGPEINLGLDLAGGSHILLEGDTQAVQRDRLETMEEAVRDALAEAEPDVRIGDVSTANGRLSFMLDDPSELDRARYINFRVHCEQCFFCLNLEFRWSQTFPPEKIFHSFSKNIWKLQKQERKTSNHDLG